MAEMTIDAILEAYDETIANYEKALANYEKALNSEQFSIVRCHLEKRCEIFVAGRDALREKQEWNSFKPLTCKGCKEQGKWENEFANGYECPCIYCKRMCADLYCDEAERSAE